MDKKIDVKYECEGTGFVAVADNGGEGVEHVECGLHHPAFKDAPSVDVLRPRQFSSSRSEARLQQIDFPDEFAGCLVRELVGP